MIGSGIAIVAVIGLILGLSWAGVAPLYPSTSNGDLPFSSAQMLAASTLSDDSGGGWTLVWAEGFHTRNATSLPFGTGCPSTGGSPPVSKNLSIPASTSPVGSGEAGAWIFLYRNTSGGATIVSVSAGVPSILATATGACTTGVSYFAPIPPNVIDSTVAADAANAAGGTAFLEIHPGANAAFALFGGLSFPGLSLPAEWGVAYSTCAFNETGSPTGQSFNATIDPLTGALLGSGSPALGCVGGGSPPPPSGGSGPPPLGTVLALGTPSEAASSGQFVYNWTVQASGGGIVADDLSFQVMGATGAFVQVPGGVVQLLSVAGSSVATYSFATSSWTSGGSVPLRAGMTLSLATTTSLSGDTLWVSGVGSFQGSVVEQIS